MNVTTNCFHYVAFLYFVLFCCDNFSCTRRKQNEDGEDKWTQSWNKSLKLGMDSISMEQPIRERIMTNHCRAYRKYLKSSLFCLNTLHDSFENENELLDYRLK